MTTWTYRVTTIKTRNFSAEERSLVLDKLFRNVITRKLLVELCVFCYQISVFFFQCHDTLRNYFELVLQERDALRLDAIPLQSINGGNQGCNDGGDSGKLDTHTYT